MATEFHVSPTGNDAHDGLSSRRGNGARGPWATVAGARDALRRLRAEGRLTGPARVVLHPGRYPIAETLEFSPADSHTSYVAARAGTAVIDGGEELRGFREERIDGRRAWVLDLPEVAAGRWYFRSLFVNGLRRPRARYPKFTPDADGVRRVLHIGQMRFPEKRDLFAGDHVFKPAPGDFQAWPSLPDAEIVLLHYWVETRLPAPRYDPATGWVTCARRSVFNLYESFNLKPARYYIDNLREALTEPGEWYLDRTSGRLTYLPRAGERLGKTRLVAPRVTHFVSALGDAFDHGRDVINPWSARPVEALAFDGLIFTHADWFQPQAEFIKQNRLGVKDVPLGGAGQAAVNVPGAIEFRWCRNCRIERCTVERTGFYGVQFGEGCRDCRITHSTLRDLGGGGVRTGGCELDGPEADRTTGTVVEDNRITDIGRVFHQGVGVLLTHAAECVVAHNHIARTCYTGISCGWSWGYRDTISRNNRIENNLIHDIGQGVLSDMGGIYLLGVQPGTVVRGNHIHCVASADYGGWGIYPDEGSSHLVVEHNWVHDIQGSPFRIHYAREVVVRDNVFARSAKEGLVGIGRVEAWRSATVVNNLLLGPAPALFEGGYAGDARLAFRSDANLIWFPDGKVAPCLHPPGNKQGPRRVSWSQWRAAGHDRASVVANPRARETADSFTLPPGSPALRTGFRPYDWSVCGPRRGRH